MEGKEEVIEEEIEEDFSPIISEASPGRQAGFAALAAAGVDARAIVEETSQRQLLPDGLPLILLGLQQTSTGTGARVNPLAHLKGPGTGKRAATPIHAEPGKKGAARTLLPVPV